MLLVALFCNNLDPERQYPQYWSHNFPLYEKGKSLVGGCLGGATAGAAGTLGVPSSPLSRSNSSPLSYPDVASVELVDDIDASRHTPPRSQTPRAGWAAEAVEAAAAAGTAEEGRGHVVNSQVLEEEDTASPV